MEVKLESGKVERAGDELIQQLLVDILAGLKKKMVQPLVEGNQRIAGKLEELKAQDQAGVNDLLERLAALEMKVQQVPLVILSAIRVALY